MIVHTHTHSDMIYRKMERLDSMSSFNTKLTNTCLINTEAIPWKSVKRESHFRLWTTTMSVTWCRHFCYSWVERFLKMTVIGRGRFSHSCHSIVSLLFQRCIDHSCIPSEWKIHLITPLFKKGDPTSVTNYRPISLLCSISKVLERLIFNYVSDHIFPYLSDKQFGVHSQ